jgi:hypothetical protein
MEDLASVVLNKLQVSDGPGPLMLLYRYASMGRHTRMMAIRAMRVNGATGYEVSICNVYWHFAGQAEGQPPRPRWQVLLFGDERVAATFAVSFIDLQPRSNRDGCPDMITYAAKDLEHLFEWSDDGVAYLNARLDNGDLSLYSANQFGQYGITCVADLQTAMLTLMPLTARIHCYAGAEAEA